MTRPVDRTGTLAFWNLIALTTVIWASQPWSPPPPSAEAVAVGGLAGFLGNPLNSACTRSW